MKKKIDKVEEIVDNGVITMILTSKDNIMSVNHDILLIPPNSVPYVSPEALAFLVTSLINFIVKNINEKYQQEYMKDFQEAMAADIVEK